MSKQPNIEAIYKIDATKTSSPVKPEDLSDEIVKASDQDQNKVYYTVDKGGHVESIFDTILNTLAGENKAGKIIAKGEHVVSHFIPKGQYLVGIADAIGRLLKTIDS